MTLSNRAQYFRMVVGFHGVQQATRETWSCSSSARSGGAHRQSIVQLLAACFDRVNVVHVV